MKQYSFLNKAFILMMPALICLQLSSNAQSSGKNKKEDKIAEVQNLIQSKRFVFVAQYANPMRGRNINLTSVYDVRFSNDTIVADLPYYGRAFVAPIDPAEGGIHFTSTKFAYTIKEKKKGGWDITISPKDNHDVSQLSLTVSEEGYGSLQVTGNNRDPINFTGYIIAANKFK